jgi:hypothetical protein
MFVKTIAIAALMLFFQCRSGFAQQCLHEGGETPDQQARRKEALAAARMINTIQHNLPPARNGIFLGAEDLANMIAAMYDKGVPMMRFSFAPDTDITPGWRLALDLTKNGYWFSINDVTDPCGFAYISNTSGLIYNAQHLR